MTEHVKEPLLNYWYRALHSPAGIEIITSDPDGARLRLYKVRQEARDPDLDQISISLSPFDPSKLWLRKRNPSNETP